MSSIQYTYYKLIENDYDVIINDDGSGEAADLVCISANENKIDLLLVHCKFSSEKNPGSRLADLYEVCGQAQRSVRWKHLGLHYLFHHIKHRESLWKSRKQSRFLKGTIADLSSIKNKSRKMKIGFDVRIVQPGVSKSKISDEMKKLLGSTELFIKKTTMSDLEVICSD